MGIGLVNAGTWPYADGPCTDTSGAPTCSEIPSMFAWGRKAPSVHSVPRGGRIRVLFRGGGYVPEREDLHNLLLLSLKRAIRWLRLKARNIKQ